MRIVWRQRPIHKHINEVAYRGNASLPDEIKMMSPLQLFSYFFNDTIIELIVDETNHAAKRDKNLDLKLTSDELRRYIGILIFMSVYHYPKLESYWGKYAFLPIQKSMVRRRFEDIKQFLCFENEDDRKKKGEPGYDPLFRLRKIADELNKQFDSIPKTARLCVDEQMCSTKTQHHLRQYMSNKPHKWGVKLFVLCDSHGYAYRFEVYNGAGDNIVLPGLPDFGATSNVVVRLSQTIPDFMHHIVYFDNFYTSVQLLVYLRSRGIFSLGTIKANRIPNSKLPTDEDVRNEKRGYSSEYTTQAHGVEISVVLWKDNKNVRLASTYVGVEPFRRTEGVTAPNTIPRYDRKKKVYENVDCPQIIKEYNRHMGGVDLMDGLMGRYHIEAKSRDVMMRLFYHFIDMAVTNAYILNNRIRREIEVSKRFPYQFSYLTFDLRWLLVFRSGT